MNSQDQIGRPQYSMRERSAKKNGVQYLFTRAKAVGEKHCSADLHCCVVKLAPSVSSGPRGQLAKGVAGTLGGRYPRT